MSDALAPTGHAEQMDRMYRYQRHIYDLTRKYYLFGRDGMIRGLGADAGTRVLEVGCGTGRNLALVRRNFPDAQLYGLDISKQMLQSARATFASELQPPTFKVADATTFTARDFGVTGFHRIMISYALSMIPHWEDAIAAALAALEPGGSLHIVDFGQQERLPRLFRSALQRWLTRFHVTPRADLREVLDRHRERIGADMMFEEIGGGYAWRVVIRKKN